jgi:hypothetical protein
MYVESLSTKENISKKCVHFNVCNKDQPHHKTQEQLYSVVFFFCLNSVSFL